MLSTGFLGFSPCYSKVLVPGTRLGPALTSSRCGSFVPFFFLFVSGSLVVWVQDLHFFLLFFLLLLVVFVWVSRGLFYSDAGDVSAPGVVKSVSPKFR